MLKSMLTVLILLKKYYMDPIKICKPFKTSRTYTHTLLDEKRKNHL